MVDQKYALSALSLMVFLSLGQPSIAQETTDSINPPQTTSATVPEIQEVPPAKDTLQKVDAVFKVAVDAMEKVLFYRLGRTERTFIVFERNAIYQRPQGSRDSFVNVSPQDVDQPRELSESQVKILEAQGKLLKGHMINGASQSYRLGTTAGQTVEYLTIKQDSPDETVRYGDRFAFVSGTGEYQQIQKKRNLPGDKKLSQSTVDEWNRQGFLKANSNPAPGEPEYLLQEPVGGIPFVVAWLALGAVFFTLYMRGFNIWGFRHAFAIIRGKYDNPAESGEVSHFQALASALSATVGLGNIAGVTIAMTVGGPGAFFWMLLCGFLGMCSKFTECTLGQKYRLVKPDGTVLGGPMRYLKVGLTEMKLGILGGVLSVSFTIMCILASFGGGNMLQANQAGSAMLQMFQQNQLEQVSVLSEQIEAAAQAENIDGMLALQQQKETLQGEIQSFADIFKKCYGVILALLVGAVIIGGIKRIGAAAGKIVPAMCLMYSLACLYIILRHITQVPAMFGLIFSEAFTGNAMGGGILGVLVVGVQRAAFSNEAGAGSAAIAHSAARTNEPIREGCVALLEPFIDTIVVCSMTALVILITGAWDNSAWTVEQGLQGAALTSRAFKEEISWFPVLLSIAVTLFAYSTIISWSYYGERAWETLFGARSTVIYKILAVIAVFVGAVVNLGSVLDFSDMMILGMAFPNILGVVILAPKVRHDLLEYWRRYEANEFKTFK